MASELGTFLRDLRIGQRLTLQSLAKRVAYRNCNKGARRIERLERDGVATAELLDGVALALGLDRRKVMELAARDELRQRTAFQVWVRMPQAMELHRFVASVTVRSVLPESMTQEQAVEYASSVQKQEGVRVCVVLDRQWSLWFAPDGSRYVSEARPDRLNFPFTTIG